MVKEILSLIVDQVWGLPLVLLLIGGGAYLVLVMIRGGLWPMAGMVHSLKLVSGSYHHKGEEKAEGQLTHFQALCNALAGTVGLGNISGVAVAIHQGGSGAVFWMWVAAIIGMNTKFFECSLAVMYRGKDYRGEVQGGPMYVMTQTLGKWGKPMAISFAVFGLLGTLALFQMNQLASYFESQYQLPNWIVGVVSSAVVAVVMWGGVRRLAKVTTALVPTMCLLYVIFCVLIVFLNFAEVPGVIVGIFRNAFSGTAIFGGAVGYAFMETMKIGVKRAAFSNEAGVGTAPMAHGNVKTNEPISEGLVAMLGPFLDTIVVCTMTALVILTSVPEGYAGPEEGILMTLKAFEVSLPGFGRHFLGISILLFGFTTILGMANYNEKCWNFLFRGRRFLGEGTFILYFSGSLMVGAMWSQGEVVHLLDISLGLMAVPNMIATLILAPRVLAALKKYIRKYHAA